MKKRISAYIDIHRIEFMVTYQCTGKCKHCSVGDQLNQGIGPKHVRIAKACEAVAKLSRLFDISSVMTFGGEPLLYPDVVCAIHRQAMACDIDCRQLITNGFFTRDEQKRKETVRKLKLSGINDLLLSVDAFHDETIPYETAYAFAKDVRDSGISNIRLSPAWVVDECHDNAYNVKTKRILAAFSDLEIPVSKGNNIFMAGNAVTHLAAFYDNPHVGLSDTCGAMPYTEPLTSISSLSIVPNGDVMICNFAIGNLYNEDIASIVARYDPYQNEWMRAIITGGASALLAHAEKKGIAIDVSQCYSVCDICKKVIKQSSAV